MSLFFVGAINAKTLAVNIARRKEELVMLNEELLVELTCLAKLRLGEIMSSAANPAARFIPDYNELTLLLAWLHEAGKVIVQTSGVFDILHSGHVQYLEEAKKLGDILVVGVDTDSWTRTRKGPGRPVRPFEERVKVLAHFRHVDLLTLQDGSLHEFVRPDILVTSESTADMTPEKEARMRSFCGRLVCLPPQSEIHSTGLIAKMNGRQ